MPWNMMACAIALAGVAGWSFQSTCFHLIWYLSQYDNWDNYEPSYPGIVLWYMCCDTFMEYCRQTILDHPYDIAAGNIPDLSIFSRITTLHWTLVESGSSGVITGILDTDWSKSLRLNHLLILHWASTICMYKCTTSNQRNIFAYT